MLPRVAKRSGDTESEGGYSPGAGCDVTPECHIFKNNVTCQLEQHRCTPPALCPQQLSNKQARGCGRRGTCHGGPPSSSQGKPCSPPTPAHTQHHPWQIALLAWPLSGLGPSSPLLFPKPLPPSPPPGPEHNLPPECSQALLRGLCTLPLFLSNSFTCNSSNLIQKYFLWLCCL